MAAQKRLVGLRNILRDMSERFATNQLHNELRYFFDARKDRDGGVVYDPTQVFGREFRSPSLLQDSPRVRNLLLNLILLRSLFQPKDVLNLLMGHAVEDIFKEAVHIASVRHAATSYFLRNHSLLQDKIEQDREFIWGIELAPKSLATNEPDKNEAPPEGGEPTPPPFALTMDQLADMYALRQLEEAEGSPLSDSVDDQAARALLLYELRCYQQAQAAANAVLKDHPDHPIACYVSALLLLRVSGMESRRAGWKAFMAEVNAGERRSDLPELSSQAQVETDRLLSLPILMPDSEKHSQFVVWFQQLRLLDEKRATLGPRTDGRRTAGLRIVRGEDVWQSAQEFVLAIRAMTPYQTVSLGRFKAFSKTQRIPIRPLTLIFGPNSAGKSSFLHGMLFAHEAMTNDGAVSLDVRRTALGGDAVDLGGFKQFLFGRGRTDPKTVEWGAEVDTSNLSGRLAELLAPVKKVGVFVQVGQFKYKATNALEPSHWNPYFSDKVTTDAQREFSAGVRVVSYELRTDNEVLLRASLKRKGDAIRFGVDELDDENPVIKQTIKAIVQSSTSVSMLGTRTHSIDLSRRRIAW